MLHHIILIEMLCGRCVLRSPIQFGGGGSDQLHVLIVASAVFTTSIVCIVIDVAHDLFFCPLLLLIEALRSS